MLILFILIPLDYHPKVFFLSNDTILYNIKKKRYLFFVVTFVFFFFIKKFQDGNSIYNILYKILDPINTSKNGTNLKDYFYKLWECLII